MSSTGIRAQCCMESQEKESTSCLRAEKEHIFNQTLTSQKLGESESAQDRPFTDGYEKKVGGFFSVSLKHYL